jgi:tRNA(fMet)-specific endonuclease VapC
VKYMLDTDTCIYALKQERSVLEKMLGTPRAEIVLSAITKAELLTGAAKSRSATKTARLLHAFLAPLAVLDFTSEDAVEYANIRASLEQKGTPIGPLDTLIASHARARGVILVTNNEVEFKRVEGLRITNWRKP